MRVYGIIADVWWDGPALICMNRIDAEELALSIWEEISYCEFCYEMRYSGDLEQSLWRAKNLEWSILIDEYYVY